MKDVAGLVPFVLIALVFWLPDRPAPARRQQAWRARSRPRGRHEVMLGSGIFGTVASLDDETLDARAVSRHHVKVARQAVVKVHRRTGAGRRPHRTTVTTTERRATERPTRPVTPTGASARSVPENRRPGPSRVDEERVAVASKTARPGRRLIVFGVGRGRAVRRRRPRRRVEAQAGPRPAGRHPDHAGGQHRQRPGRHPGEPRGGARDHRPARQRHRCRGVRGRHPGQRNIVVEIPGPEPRATSSTP